MIIEYGMHYAMPAGGLFSTAGDLAKFCQMVLNGGVYNGRRYLSEDAIKQMTSVQTGTVFPNSDYGYGLGWTVKRTASGLPGAGSFGHRGAGSPHMWIDREKQLVMIVLVQRLDMPGKDENNLYDAFLKAAIDKYGHIH
jgi:CubicO group peptidase (beta-lactamase class C family)